MKEITEELELDKFWDVWRLKRNCDHEKHSSLILCNNTLSEYVEIPEDATKIWMVLSPRRTEHSYEVRLVEICGGVLYLIDGVKFGANLYPMLAHLLRECKFKKIYGRIEYI